MFATTKEVFVYVYIYVQPSSDPQSPFPPRSVNSSSMNSPDSSSNTTSSFHRPQCHDTKAPLSLSLSLLKNFPKENNNRRPWVHAAWHKKTLYFSTIIRNTKSPENNNKNKNRKTEAQQTSSDGEEQLASNDNVPVQREGRGEDVEGQWGWGFQKTLALSTVTFCFTHNYDS
jgi:hypothetical protein